MSYFSYESCIKIGGQPILPPVILPEDRPLLQYYKEEAVRREKEIKERSESVKNALARELASELSDGETDESTTSQTSVKTAQVMWFIRQALRNVGVNADDVKSLQSQIFQELNDIQKSNSCDTLHNFEDSSVFASTSVEASPETAERPAQSEPVERVDDNVSSVSEFEQSLSLPLPSTPVRYSSEEGVSPSKEQTSPRVVQSLSSLRTIRRNSYTLSSPSPSVLSYFKALTKSPKNVNSSVKRNLNEVWSTPDPSPHVEPQVFSLDNQKNESGDTNANTSWLEDVATQTREEAAAKIQAGVRGYLTRRLLRTSRVTELKNSIKDSLITALELFTDPEVNDRNELELRKHLTLQVEKLCDEWHSIIVDSTPAERMKIIRLDREKIERQKLSKSVPKRPATKRSDSASAVARPKSQPVKTRHLRTTSDYKSKRPATAPLALSRSLPSAYKPLS